MLMEYQILTDATADMSEEMLEGYPKLEIIPMQVEVGGEQFLLETGRKSYCKAVL